MQVCQEEKDNGKLAIPLSAAIDRASMYTGVSRASIFNFKTDDLASEMEPIPRSDTVDLDNFDKGLFRRTFHDLSANQHILPTAATLKVLVYFVKIFKFQKEHFKTCFRACIT